MRKLASAISGSTQWVIAGVLLIGLCLTRLHSFLLFHSLAEMFSVVVACGIFMIAWNTRRFQGMGYLEFVGIAYLFVGILDLVHTLAYKGMGVFEGYDTDLATQLWLSARYAWAARNCTWSRST